MIKSLAQYFCSQKIYRLIVHKSIAYFCNTLPTMQKDDRTLLTLQRQAKQKNKNQNQQTMKTRNTLTVLAILLTLTFALPPDTLGQGKGKGGPPPWAPAHGYRAKTRHIYFHDHNFYFDVQKNVYIYMSGGKWQVGVKPPSIYAGIDLKGAAKVELEINTDTPQKYNSDHIVKYKAKGKGGQMKVKTASPGKGKKK